MEAEDSLLRGAAEKEAVQDLGHLQPTQTHTFTGSRWDPDANKVLESQHTSQEEAVLGPDLGNSFPPASIHDCDQSKGVKHGVEVHPLPDHVDHQQKARLKEKT